MAEESLLHYGEAARCLESAMNLAGRRDRRDLKKLALLHECDAAWARLGLCPAELANLGGFLREQLAAAPVFNDTRWTEAWLARNFGDQADDILAAIRERGGFSDVQILNNIVFP